MSEPSYDYDLVVIGSGPAGYRASIQSAKLGKSVAIVEKTLDRLGGAWIHTGTIPSKTIRESMDQIHAISFHAGSRWVERIIDDISTTKLMGRAHKVAQSEEQIFRKYLDRYKIETVFGRGSLDSPHAVRVVCADSTVKIISARNILVCTGSRPRRPEDIPFDGWRIVDCDEILKIEHVPKSMIIYGGGVVGCEYACIFSALGVDTTVIEGRDKIMQYIDQEVVEKLKASMEESGVKFLLGNKLKQIKTKGPSAVIELENGDKHEASILFFAAGRVPNTENLGLEKLGITKSERGYVEVNEHFQTAVPNVYSAGDCIGPPALAATSAVQGRYAAAHMFGKACKPFPKVFPVGVYTIPELSSVGSTEEELIAQNIEYVVGRAFYREVARGYIRGDEHGMLKLLVCKTTHKILGIHVVGHDACNLIHTGQAIMKMHGHAQDFVNMVYNYPTLSESYSIAAFNALNKIFTDGDILDPPKAVDDGETFT